MQTGLYEQLLTVAMEQKLGALTDPRLYEVAPVDAEDAHSSIAQLLEHLLANSLAQFRGSDTADRQKRLVDRIISTLAEELGPGWVSHLSIATPLRRLLAIHTTSQNHPQERPDTPLSRSALLTGTRLDPSLGVQLRKEIATADRVDILCSFIRWSGLRIILEELKNLMGKQSTDGPRLRVITTSYMGATDPRAIEEISKLPNTEIRISYDTKRTRLHAKAYIFHRETGFGSAYVGSANLSNAALSEGLEWTTKISHYELPYLWKKIEGTFQTYWQDDDFQIYQNGHPEKLRKAIQIERDVSSNSESMVRFDLRPFPFQEEILDVLAAEREGQNKTRHLVVAATGTGKTMVAAFDYSRFCAKSKDKPPLLFVAHREEILRQALGSFRGVLKDQNFGDLMVGGEETANTNHLFCSIQSYNSKELWKKSPKDFQYIVVDEFHHATAPSYRRLLDHVQPEILLGLTATPERTDQLDILSWFGNKASAEIRLPDAINRRLLCPFQYFGVSDSVNLDQLAWQRGGYQINDLSRLYTGNDSRALLVVEKVQEILLDCRKARALGFCVSKAHADFMAHYFRNQGIPAESLTSDSTQEERRSVQDKLRTRSINFIFVVDLYNEGVDIPEVDTILFLRPTESLTVYLQQFGRGLRLHPEKDFLTLIDFIGAQRQEFRYSLRFRALSTKPTGPLDQEIENGFPHLPSGCTIQLERIAQNRVLENIRSTIRLIRPRILSSLRDLKNHLGRIPTPADAIDYLETNLDELLKRGLWSRLLSDAGLAEPPQDPDEERLAKGIRRLCHTDCSQQIREWLQILKRENPGTDPARLKTETMLMVDLWGEECLGWPLEEAYKRLIANPASLTDLVCILSCRLNQAPANHSGRLPDLSGPLTIHSQYTRDEILVGLGHWNMDRRPDQREGVLHLSFSKVDAFFVTLQKTDDEFSPTTMYEDYLISHEIFHWQSQSNTSVESLTGQRYINHRRMGYTPLLFVREAKKLPSGLSSPYAYLGPCDYVSHEGSRPISLIWKLRHSVPARLFRWMARQSVA